MIYKITFYFRKKEERIWSTRNTLYIMLRTDTMQIPVQLGYSIEFSLNHSHEAEPQALAEKNKCEQR